MVSVSRNSFSFSSFSFSYSAQVGSPTWAKSLAETVWLATARRDIKGVRHCTNAGVASWYDFAVAIAEEAVAAGVLKSMPQVTPIASDEYPTPVRRPSYSVLDKSATHVALNLPHVHWRQRLREVVAQLEPAA